MNTYLFGNEEMLIRTKNLVKIIRSLTKQEGPIYTYGVPRGGIPVVYLLRAVDPMFYFTEDADLADVIVDDILVSGKTKDKYTRLYNKPFVVLVNNPNNVDDTWYVFPWENTVECSAEDIPIRMLNFIGEKTDRDGLKDTPKRVINSWKELYRGYTINPDDIIREFDNDEHYDQMVILKNIEFYSTCEHHLLPFFGKIHIAYIPSVPGRVIGISKLARLVDCFSRRLQVQERLTQQIANYIDEKLTPVGVAVMIEAQHLCMIARGVQKQHSIMITSALKGICKDSEAARLEFLSMIKG